MYSCYFCSMQQPDNTRKKALSSPPGEYDFVEVVITPGKEALFHDVWLDAHCVALPLNIPLYTVQQVFDRWNCLPRSESHHRLLIGLQAVDGIFIKTQIILCTKHTDHDGGLAGSDSLSSGNTNQDLEIK